ncbi:MAG TPA: lysophospholipid acyltransferase family protein [Symbiobacteriaceae bacterium]|nr:lysophospholipid acyltransferase family protein [Symbiobacteriaceae bacterium]
MFRLLYRIRVEGAQHVPRTGGVIVCANHTKAIDPIFLGIACPRPVQFMAKQEIFQVPVLGWLVRQLNAFPVDRAGNDRGALKRSLTVLESGGCFGIFPEGTRVKSGELGEFHGGTAYLALKAGAQVVPVGITPGYKLFETVVVRFGAPVDLDEFRAGKVNGAVRDAASQRISEAVAAQVQG